MLPPGRHQSAGASAAKWATTGPAAAAEAWSAAATTSPLTAPAPTGWPLAKPILSNIKYLLVRMILTRYRAMHPVSLILS
jgi:hypothetical protein